MDRTLRTARVAIVHEWLVNYAGSERVVEQLLQVFPEAELFATVDFLPPEERDTFLGGRRAKTTFIQHLPGARAHYRGYLPLMPLAVEQHDLSGYDIVISSSHAVAKGVLTGPDQLHICYCHSPIRYAWDLQHQYLSESGLAEGVPSWLARALLHYMRLWDARTSHGVDVFVANSAFVARRVRKAYGRRAEIIHPPVNVAAFPFQREKQDYYLTASRLVPYKRVPMIVEAFAQRPDRKLVVIGDGPDLPRARQYAAFNVEFKGYQSQAKLRQYMQGAKAFVYAAEEDFGIVLVEAQACGTPVVAYGKGGALENILSLGQADRPTGLFFEEQSPDALNAALDRFEANQAAFRPEACRQHAERFSNERFRSEVRALVQRAWGEKGRAVAPRRAPVPQAVAP